MVEPFDRRPGIEKIVSGYTGGSVENPTYQEVCSETTGHLEAVQITYNPNIFPYDELLEIYWQQIDPTDAEVSLPTAGSPINQLFFTMMMNKSN